jgi:hypothetical protein
MRFPPVLAWLVVLAGGACSPRPAGEGRQAEPRRDGAPATVGEPPMQPRREGEEVSYLLELELDREEPATGYGGEAIVADADPRFVIVARVVRSSPPGPFAPGARQAFAVHDPEALGLHGWRRADTVTVVLVRTATGDGTRWRIHAAKPN